MNLMTHPDAIAEVAALLEPVEKALEKSPKSPFAPLSEFRGSKSSNSELDAWLLPMLAGWLVELPPKTSAKKSEPFELDWAEPGGGG